MPSWRSHDQAEQLLSVTELPWEGPAVRALKGREGRKFRR
jgi:hypothetical protein